MDLHAVLTEAAGAVAEALAGDVDWGPSGGRAGQYASDLTADAAAVAVLAGHGLGVLSEESGLQPGRAELLVVLDPLDGSTNASLGLPWYATSLCVLDAEGPVASLVVNLATGRTYRAERGAGATVDDRRLAPRPAVAWREAVALVSGMTPEPLGWAQFRAYGAAALDLCAVAEGRADAFVDCSPDAHGPWDYLGGVLVCLEAGAAVADAHGRDLVVRDHDARRTPVAATDRALLDEVLARRRRFP